MHLIRDEDLLIVKILWHWNGIAQSLLNPSLLVLMFHKVINSFI